MNHMTVYLKDKVLTDNFIGTGVHVALYDGDEEMTAKSYVRQSVTFNAPENGQMTNDQDILFPVATEQWGNVTHVGLVDTKVGGNVLFKAPAEFAKTIDVSSQYKIPAQYLIVRMR